MEMIFGRWKCKVTLSRYDNNRTAILLTDATDGELIATATVNLPGSPCPDGHTYIKDWSENEGMLQALLDAKVVEDTGRMALTGFTSANLVRVLVK